jgi:predicted nucleic acid-binding protein
MLAIDQVEPQLLVGRMWALRGNMSAYDAAYVTAAEMLRCPLVTGDARLARAPDVRCAVQLIR